jgi:hypothetical protein
MPILKEIRLTPLTPEEIASAAAKSAQHGAHAVIIKSADKKEHIAVSKQEAMTEDEVATLAKTFVSDTVNEARARDMAVARLAHERGLYDAMYLGKGGTAEPATVEKAAAEVTFDKHVADIRKRDKCSGTEAMARARAEHPAAFEALQTA